MIRSILFVFALFLLSSSSSSFSSLLLLVQIYLCVCVGIEFSSLNFNDSVVGIVVAVDVIITYYMPSHIRLWFAFWMEKEVKRAAKKKPQSTLIRMYWMFEIDYHLIKIYAKLISNFFLNFFFFFFFIFLLKNFHFKSFASSILFYSYVFYRPSFPFRSVHWSLSSYIWRL